MTDIETGTPTDPGASGGATNAELRREIGSLRTELSELREGRERAQPPDGFYRTFFELAPTGHLALDFELDICEVNLAATRLLHRGREELIGRPLGAFVSPEDRSHIERQLRTLAPGTVSSLEARLDRGELASLPSIITTIRASANGDDRLLCSILDIADRKHAEAVTRRKVALRAKDAQMTRSSEDLARFAYVAAHDLQEPLRMITSYGALLSQGFSGKLGDDADRYIDYMTEGARRMSGLIAGILELSRVDASGTKLGVVSSQEITTQAVAELAELIGESRAVIEFEGLPWVLGDHAQLVRLIRELIRNAIHFRSSRTPTVLVSAGELEEEWVFRIADNGVGIRPRDFERVFTVFKHVHPIPARAGIGIGLALAKKIVEAHGGRIWVESKPGEGTTLSFTLLGA